MLIRYILLVFAFITNFVITDNLLAVDEHDARLIYVGGKSASSSSATTATTSVPATRYSTPSVQLPARGLNQGPLEFYLDQRSKRKLTKKEIRKRNNELLRIFGIP
jgi:hypothetical protein